MRGTQWYSDLADAVDVLLQKNHVHVVACVFLSIVDVFAWCGGGIGYITSRFMCSTILQSSSHMTSLRGPLSRTTRGDQSTESYLLIPTHLWSEDTVNHPEEEVDPDSDAALLRTHRDEEDGDDGENKHLPNINGPNILRRLINFMSRAPLLPGSSQAPETSYGSLPARRPVGNSDIDEEDEEDDEVIPRGRRKGKSSDLRHVDTISPTKSMGSLRSQNGVGSKRSMGTLRSQTGSVSISRRRTRRSEPAPENIYASGTGLPTGDGAKLFEGLAPTMSTEHLSVEEEGQPSGDEEAMLVEGEESEVDDEDPPDNSPLVHRYSISLPYHIGGCSRRSGISPVLCLLLLPK